LQRGNFASQALNSIQNVGGIHAYSIRLIFGPRCEMARVVRVRSGFYAEAGAFRDLAVCSVGGQVETLPL
jgi:hypothetical protein